MLYHHDLMRVIPLENAEELSVKAAHAAGLSNRDSLVLDLMLKAVPTLEVDGRFVVRLDDVHGFLSNLERAIRERDSSFLLLKRGLCVDRMVDVEEFVESPDYLNQKGYVRPAIKRKLLELFAPGNEFVEAVLCLHKDTRVPLLDGTKPTIEELAARPPGERYWLYSQVDGRMAPAQGRFAHKTGKDVIWKVSFTDGTSVRANARHQFENTSGQLVMVKDLKAGDCLASLYLEKKRLGSRGRRYLSYVEGGKRKWVHRTVAEFVTGVSRWSDHVRHHQDFNPLNNCPENLQWLSHAEHSEVHKVTARANIEKYNQVSEVVRRSNAQSAAKKSNRWRSEEQKEAAAERMRRRNLEGLGKAAADDFWCSSEGDQERIARRVRMAEFNSSAHPNRRTDLSKEDLIRVASACKVFGDLKKALNCSATKVYALLYELGMTYKEFRDEYMPVAKGRHRALSNHVVAKVECLGYEEDVYCLTVDGPGVFFVEVDTERKGGDAHCACVLSSNTGAI